MPILTCYIIVDVKFNAILIYSNVSSTHTCINCVFRRIYPKIIRFNVIINNVYMYMNMLVKVTFNCALNNQVLRLSR